MSGAEVVNPDESNKDISAKPILELGEALRSCIEMRKTYAIEHGLPEEFVLEMADGIDESEVCHTTPPLTATRLGCRVCDKECVVLKNSSNKIVLDGNDDINPCFPAIVKYNAE